LLVGERSKKAAQGFEVAADAVELLLDAVQFFPDADDRRPSTVKLISLT
jgi:hypothetical protein